MIKKTKDYGMFKLRPDNREGIVQHHVDRLVASIQSRNLLDMRPILVNEDMEVIDGQHRLMAAKKLGLDIYYEIKKDLRAEDIILMNINKSWSTSDFLNFYVKQGNPNYIKLKKFISDNNITLKIALVLLNGNLRNRKEEFKNGNFIFKDNLENFKLDYAWETIEYIKKINGHCYFTHAGKFWGALIRLTSHEDFDMDVWRQKLQRFADRITPKASIKDYEKMLKDIYNWKNQAKIDFGEE